MRILFLKPSNCQFNKIDQLSTNYVYVIQIRSSLHKQGCLSSQFNENVKERTKVQRCLLVASCTDRVIRSFGYDELAFH